MTGVTHDELEELAKLDDARPDPLLLRIGLIGLIAVALVALGLAGATVLTDRNVPDLFVAIPSAAVGSIGTLLIPGRRTS